MRQAQLQAVADAAALAGARELVLANANEDAIASLTRASVIENLGTDADGVSVSTTMSTADRTVNVAVNQFVELSMLAGLAGIESSPIAVNATAKVAGEMPICMLILDPYQRAALALIYRARITGNDCAVQTNSSSSRAIVAGRDSSLVSKLTCSGGGVGGDPRSYEPAPLTDCPPVEDPLASRSAPPASQCTEKGLVLIWGRHTIHPGTYCRGIAIGGSADVTFSPGVYIVKDGPLIVGGQAKVSGEHVGFFLTGDNATFNFQPQTTIDLSAPKDGPLAGILFFEDRNNDPLRRHLIRSNGARSVVGTIYLPQGELVIDATKPLFEESAYTVIIARRMNMFSGPNLILNSNYEDTDVPVPSEMNGTFSHGDKVVLTK